MSKRRMLFPAETAVFHVMNRVVRKEFWLDESCREIFISMLRRQARFSGLEILTYCMMSNHFHLLVRVPPSALKSHLEGYSNIDDATLLKRYHEFYGNRKPLSGYSYSELKERLSSGGVVAEQARRRVLARMGDLSVFMRELKYRFITWFNDKFENEGTVWSTKFKSVVVEDVPEVRSKVAAYIDLNPVRAGMTDDPGTYRWCGYAAAVAGQTVEAEAVAALCGHHGSLADYRRLLFTLGQRPRIKADGNPAGVIKTDLADAELSVGATNLIAEALRSRWRFLTNATAIGSASFIQKLADATKRRRRQIPKTVDPAFGEAIRAIGRKITD